VMRTYSDMALTDLMWLLHDQLHRDDQRHKVTDDTKLREKEKLNGTKSVFHTHTHIHTLSFYIKRIRYKHLSLGYYRILV
jgi:hypothetical protein